MDGNVNLRDETMNLTIHPHTKGFRVISLRSPLYVTGSFKQPHVGVKAGALIARGGAAIGLGLLHPLASLLALLQPGRSRPLPCGQMLADMEQRPTAPPPGIRQKTKAAPAYMTRCRLLRRLLRPLVPNPGMRSERAWPPLTAGTAILAGCDTVAGGRSALFHGRPGDQALGARSQIAAPAREYAI